MSNCYRKELSTCIVSSTAAAEDSWVWSDMCHVWFFAYAPPQPILRFESRLDIFCCLWHLVTFFVNMSIEIETFLFSFLLYHGLGHRMQTQGLTQDTLFPFFPAVPAICSSNFTTATFLQWLSEIHGSETNVFFHFFFTHWDHWVSSRKKAVQQFQMSIRMCGDP